VQQPPLIVHLDPAVREARAREIHDGGRAGTLFVVSLGRLPDTLQEAELFGVVRGCFGCGHDNPGLLARAAGGSCFIDEVTEASDDALRGLARYVTTGTIFKVGSEEPERCETRIILGAAEHGPALEAIVERLRARVA